MTDESFLSFVEGCLTLDHKKRPTSAELLKHEFIANETVQRRGWGWVYQHLSISKSLLRRSEYGGEKV